MFITLTLESNFCKNTIIRFKYNNNNNAKIISMIDLYPITSNTLTLLESTITQSHPIGYWNQLTLFGLAVNCSQCSIELPLHMQSLWVFPESLVNQTTSILLLGLQILEQLFRPPVLLLPLRLAEVLPTVLHQHYCLWLGVLQRHRIQFHQQLIEIFESRFKFVVRLLKTEIDFLKIL